MTKKELMERLKKYEWNDFECKKAQRGVPEDAYKTVSAFANTSGGYLVFGIKDEKDNLYSAVSAQVKKEPPTDIADSSVQVESKRV